MGNEKRELEPVLLKFAVPLALSIGGILYSLIMNKRSKASKSPRDPRTRSDCNNQMNSKCNHQASQTSTSSLHFDPLSTDKHDIKGYPRAEMDNNEQEIKSLRNSVRILKERERNLEIQLLEYYGQKEQETAVMELQNRLKLNNMEAKLYALKIESLQAENKRLQAQMTDYTKVVADLEAARANIKMLKRKHKSEAEQNKNQLVEFQQRVQKMQDNDHKSSVKVDPEDIKSNLNKVKILEAEVEDLRKSNDNLQVEKSDLERRLDCVQMLATSVLEDSEAEKLKEESESLKKQNEDYSKEIERLQADRCADVEELVYLRWINACLRYELRNYKPGPDGTSARDLSKSLSPKSEEKAKKMILEYASKEGCIEKNVNIPENIDPDEWSRSQSSRISYSGEIDDTFIDDPLPQKSKYKFFGKLIRMLRRKDSHQSRSRNSSRSEDMYSCRSSENRGLRLSNRSVDSQKLTRRHSDACVYKQINSIAEDDDGGGGGGRLSSSSSYGGGGGGRLSSCSLLSERSELEKYANALKDTYDISKLQFHKSSQSLGFI